MTYADLGSGFPTTQSFMGDFAKQIESAIEAAVTKAVTGQMKQLVMQLPTPQVNVAPPQVSVAAPSVTIQPPTIEMPENETETVDLGPLIGCLQDIDSHILALTALLARPVKRTVQRSNGVIDTITETRI